MITDAQVYDDDYDGDDDDLNVDEMGLLFNPIYREPLGLNI